MMVEKFKKGLKVEALRLRIEGFTCWPEGLMLQAESMHAPVWGPGGCRCSACIAAPSLQYAGHLDLLLGTSLLTQCCWRSCMS